MPQLLSVRGTHRFEGGLVGFPTKALDRLDREGVEVIVGSHHENALLGEIRLARCPGRDDRYPTPAEPAEPDHPIRAGGQQLDSHPWEIGTGDSGIDSPSTVPAPYNQSGRPGRKRLRGRAGCRWGRSRRARGRPDRSEPALRLEESDASSTHLDTALPRRILPRRGLDRGEVDPLKGVGQEADLRACNLPHQEGVATQIVARRLIHEKIDPEIGNETSLDLGHTDHLRSRQGNRMKGRPGTTGENHSPGQGVLPYPDPEDGTGFGWRHQSKAER